MSNNSSNENTNKIVNRRGKINSNISICLKDCKLFENEDVKIKNLDRLAYKNEESYQKSFQKVVDFSKTIPEKDKLEINCAIFNANNDDGLFSAWCFYKFLETNNLANESITFVPLGPASGDVM